jgi:citrate synthase
MRGLKSMLWESSVLDPNEVRLLNLFYYLAKICTQGIRFHGLSIPDCQKQLPAAPGGKEIIAESMFWLLLTGKVPTEAETRQLSRQLAEKGDLPTYVEKLIDG